MKAKVKAITITRAEGSPNAGKPFTFTSFWQADAHLSHCAYSFPKFGYDKHDVEIEWENGVSYGMRFDAKHHENKYYHGNSLEQDLLSSCRYWSNPENNEGTSLAFYKMLLDTCEINILPTQGGNE
jgi:hypothetical protein